MNTDKWTLVDRWRYGRDPAKTATDFERYMNGGAKPRTAPWIFQGENIQTAIVLVCIVLLVWIWFS